MPSIYIRNENKQLTEKKSISGKRNPPVLQWKFISFITQMPLKNNNQMFIFFAQISQAIEMQTL